MNYFELFDLPVAFSIDENELKKKYLELTKKYHPDFFTLASTKEQDNMLDMSTLINEAYRTLSDKDRRTEYILKLYGHLSEGRKLEVPQDFLLDMMDINERLAELHFEDHAPVDFQNLRLKINTLLHDLDKKASVLMEYFDRGINKETNLEQLKDYYVKSKYVKRLKNQLESSNL